MSPRLPWRLRPRAPHAPETASRSTPCPAVASSPSRLSPQHPSPSSPPAAGEPRPRARARPRTSTDWSRPARSPSRPRAPTARSPTTRTARATSSGYDVEIIEAVADKLGLEVEVRRDAVGRDLRRSRCRSLRPDRQPGVDQPRARGEVPLQRAVHGLARSHRGEGGRRLDLELRRPRRQDHRAVAHEQLVHARRRRAERTSKPSRAGRRLSPCSSRDASTPRSTTTSPTSTTRRRTVRRA